MLKAKILKDLKKCMSKLDFKFENNFSIEIPSNIEHGDFSSNIALLNARKNKMKPRDLAKKIADYLILKRDYKIICCIAGSNGFFR